MLATKKIFWVAAALIVLPAMSDPERQPGVNPGPGTRYATDAYPGFDDSEAAFRPEKKTPGWFSFWSGPKYDNAVDQLRWARECESNESWGRACRAYDALVSQWPSSPEAPIAQQRLAELRLVKDLDYEEAFSEYRYLLDFYALECDYDAVAAKLYQVVQLMRAEGKTIVFFRFKNTADVRRAYESLVLRSPGAGFAPAAMLTIGELREEEDKLDLAVTVYENLRNRYPDSEQAKVALHAEARTRMQILEERGYNRSRTSDTIDFLKMARRADLPQSMLNDIEGWLTQAKNLLAEEAYQAARFYDSSTRTRRSARSAYERFVMDYPDSPYVEQAMKRILELKDKEEK